MRRVCDLVALARAGDVSRFVTLAHDALGDAAFERLARRMAVDPVGARILAERPRVAEATFSRAELACLPEDTLGHAFLRHMSENGFDRDVDVPGLDLGTDGAYAKVRWRETHDFRHVLVGLNAGRPDEVVLAGFQLGQVPNPFSLLVVAFVPLILPLRQGPFRTWHRAFTAWRAGRRAPLLANVRFEELLGLPVAEVRRRTGAPNLAPLSTPWSPIGTTS